jgi:hypothetical protein
MANYVDNKKFTKELGIWAKEVRKCEAENKPKPKMPEYVGECIYAICHNLRYSKRFIRYTNNESMIYEMIGDAVENCIRYCKNFNGDKYNNAYGYINQIAGFAYIRYIKKEKNRYVKHLQYIKQSVSDTELRDALEADNPNDIKGYSTYIDHMQSLLDIMEVEMPTEFDAKPKKSKPGIVDKIENGERYGIEDTKDS